MYRLAVVFFTKALECLGRGDTPSTDEVSTTTGCIGNTHQIGNTDGETQIGMSE